MKLAYQQHKYCDLPQLLRLAGLRCDPFLNIHASRQLSMSAISQNAKKKKKKEGRDCESGSF